MKSIDLREAAREFIENYDGNMKNVKDNATWMRLQKAESIRSSVNANELSRGPYSRKYNTMLNFGLEWDLDQGIKPQCESLRKYHIENITTKI